MSTAQTRENRPAQNARGEIVGAGPGWACKSFGAYGHNQFTCLACIGNYMGRNEGSEEKA